METNQNMVKMRYRSHISSRNSRHKSRFKMQNNRQITGSLAKMNIQLNPISCFIILMLSLVFTHAVDPFGRTQISHFNSNLTARLLSSSTNNADGLLHQLAQTGPPAIPPTYVKLGNNTSLNSRAFNFANSHYLRNNNPATVPQVSNLTISDDFQSKRNLFEKICIGTSNRMSGQSNKTDHYQNLYERYRNCTYVIGNLEITWLEKGSSNKPLDLSFLESIREITGYLLIAYVDVDRIRMPNLQIIRGRDLFRLNSAPQEEYAMFVIQNEIKSLELPNLREIIAGDVGFNNNRNLCYINSINWDEILNSGFKPKYYIDTTSYNPPECPRCHDSCPDSCWGPGPDMCQKFSKTNCSPQCEKGRCFGPAPRECCHLFCAGGCTGPKQTDCLACKNFYNDGECIQECPPMRKYNPSKFAWDSDPNGKFAYGATCVKECPEHLLRDNGACVRSCPSDKRNLDGECVPCVGPCPKRCQGVDAVNSKNIDQLINCTEIEGSITILDTSFKGYYDINNNTISTRYEPMHPSRLKVFETIRTITGYLNIQAAHPDFRDLTFFSKLETIGGRQVTDMFHSLSIIKTSLVSLNLRSLKKVRAGGIVIEENKDLCFVDVQQFLRLNITRREEITIRNNGDSYECRLSGFRCNEQCGEGGCWGSGPNECISCKNTKLDDYCVKDCTSTESIGILSYKSGEKTCSKCHPECKSGCRSGSELDCFECRNYKDGPYCVAECPKHKYNDNGICQECHKSCIDGCSGPSDKLGEGGCKSCGKIVIESISPVLTTRCIKAEDHCPKGYYQEYGGPVSDSHPLKSLERKPVCRRCHPRCKSCNGYGTHKDVCECAGYVANDQCEDSCPRDFYAVEKPASGPRHCIQCSRECNGCHGPSEADCENCRVYRIYYDSDTPVASARVVDGQGFEAAKQRRFNCTAQCPQDKPHRISDDNLLDPYCSETAGTVTVNSSFFFSNFMIVIAIAFAFVSGIVWLFVHVAQMQKEKTIKLTMRLSGFDDIEPLNQSNLKPNLEDLRIIKETELRRGGVVGSGFGGTVYQGTWTPEGHENKEPYPVAIKVLRDDGRSNMNKEFLDEACIMARVNHPNLVKLLGVCMTPGQSMLITQMMPLGGLLDYVKTYKHEIGSKILFEWSRQIARGMAYLEENRMVHRDLALRNVLLQTSSRAVISDFGLAKFLEVDQSEYRSGEGRLPLKWLAPECITERKFTHKSDVWAFGITIWELLTFGKRPYGNLDAKAIVNGVISGMRPEKPRHVSMEVYRVMMECWLFQLEVRPDFKSLEASFAAFARDPERYLESGPNGRILTRDSDSDEHVYETYTTEQNLLDDEQSPTLSHDNDSPSNMNDLFSFEMRHHHSESETHNDHVSTPTIKKFGMFQSTNGNDQMVEDVFSKLSHSQQMSSKSSNMTITDPNNNLAESNVSRFNGDSNWTVHNTMSTNSLGQRSEQPTDLDDYLLPSPCSNEDKFTKFLASREGHSSRPPPPPPHSRDPPHSAGLIGISNQEYFMTRAYYANSNGPHNSSNASISHMPHSLV